MAVSQYDRERLTSEQQAQIQAVTDAAQAGSMDWATAHSIAEGIRAQAAGGGYSGGQSGSEYIETPRSSGSSGNAGSAGGSGSSKYTGGSAGNVHWDGDTDYASILLGAMDAGNTDSDWLQSLLNSRTAKASANPSLNQYVDDDIARRAQDYINELLANEKPSWTGQGKFDAAEEIINNLASMRYEDWAEGDQYKALAERFGRQGEMAMQDVLGQISSRTGGLASSYATTAAQQQYNDYMSQLEEVARQMYAEDRGELVDNANMYLTLGQNEWNRYQDQLNQSNVDRNFEYQAGRDQINDSRYNREYADSMAASNKADAQDRINAYLAAYGSAADLDAALVEASGYTPAELEVLERYYAEQKAAAAAKGQSGGGGGTPKPAASLDYDGLFEEAKRSGYPKSFIANNYKLFGFTSSTGLYDEYKEWDAAPEPEAGPAVKQPANNDYWLGDGTTGGGKTSLYWDEDEGIFTWNGKSYYDQNTLLKEIDSAHLTENELDELKRKFKLFGFDLS